ncbi:MAG: hypothetical protein AAGA11_12400 [Pseudomonadota bacterium]
MDEHRWSETSPRVGDTLCAGDVTITVASLPPMALVSGDVMHFATDRGTTLSGLAELINPDAAYIRLARDRILSVGDVVDQLDEGWRPGVGHTGNGHAGLAVSRIDGGYACLALSGDGTETLLQQGTSVNLRQPSPAATLLFAGQPAVLVRAPGAWWLLVDPAQLAYHWLWFSGAQA